MHPHGTPGVVCQQCGGAHSEFRHPPPVAEVAEVDHGVRVQTGVGRAFPHDIVVGEITVNGLDRQRQRFKRCVGLIGDGLHT